MDFSFNEEQTLLEESVARFIQNDYAFEDRQKLVKSDDGYSADNWKTFAELGWLGVTCLAVLWGVCHCSVGLSLGVVHLRGLLHCHLGMDPVWLVNSLIH